MSEPANGAKRHFTEVTCLHVQEISDWRSSQLSLLQALTPCLIEVADDDNYAVLSNLLSHGTESGNDFMAKRRNIICEIDNQPKRRTRCNLQQKRVVAERDEKLLVSEDSFLGTEGLRYSDVGLLFSLGQDSDPHNRVNFNGSEVVYDLALAFKCV